MTGVVGLDTQPVFGGSLRRSRRRQAPAHGREARHRQLPSGYRTRTGTPTGCPAALADRRLHPEPVPDRLRLRAAAASGVTGQGERVALIEIDGFSYSDLQAFASCFGLPVPQINGFGVGLTHPLAPGGETTLDLEVLDAAAPGLKAIDVYESQRARRRRARGADRAASEPGPPPEVISASLGMCEPDARDFDRARAALGRRRRARAGGGQRDLSSGLQRRRRLVRPASSRRRSRLDQLAVSYPASSPWVTGVGGTNVSLTRPTRSPARWSGTTPPYEP